MNRVAEEFPGGVDAARRWLCRETLSSILLDDAELVRRGARMLHPGAATGGKPADAEARWYRFEVAAALLDQPRGAPMTINPDPVQWETDKPDDEHASIARSVEVQLDTRLFAEVCDGPRGLFIPGRSFGCEDLGDYEDKRVRALADPDVWPIVYVDEAGRRYEVAVQVEVRPLPPVEVALAEHLAAAEAASKVTMPGGGGSGG